MRCYNCMKELPLDNASFCPFCGKNPNEQNTLPHRLAPGTVLHERYLIGAALGEGGFGITYVGFDKTLYIKVAVKEYYPSGIASRVNTISNTVSVNTDKQKNAFDTGKESFLREARSVAQFSKESGIVDVRDFFTENNTAYIVMEFLDGVNLNEYLHKNGVMEAKQTFKMMLPLMRALEKMHRQNVIHRDISPDNIMRQDNGTLKLMDFGAARQFSQDERKSLSVVLKPGYAPHEQYSRKGKQGPWTDVYALCATIYQCVTGETPSDSLYRAVEDDLKKPSELSVSISEELENALMKGLAVMPQDRLQSMDELIKATEAAFETNKKETEIIKEENTTIAADDQKTDESKTSAADDRETDESKIIAADVREIDENKTVAADDRENDENKTVAADDTDDDPQKTISADEPFDAADPADTKEKAIDIPQKKRNRKEPVIISVVAAVMALTIIGVIVIKTMFDSNKSESDDLTSQTSVTTNDSSYSTDELIAIRESLPKQTNLSAGRFYTIGLKSDGTAVAEGYGVFGAKGYDKELAEISNWKNIIAVSAGDADMVGLRSDGTVVAAGTDAFGECEVGDWKNIVAVSAGNTHTVGLKADGTVVAAGKEYSSDGYINHWKGIVAVSAGFKFTVGLKADGTVVTEGTSYSSEDGPSNWKDIVAVSADMIDTFGLKADGTVVTTDINLNTESSLAEWKGIVAISAGNDHIVGLKSDGTAVAAGNNDYGQCSVEGWKDIVAVSAGENFTVGLKSDGTVVAVGDNEKSQGDVSGWTNIKTN